MSKDFANADKFVQEKALIKAVITAENLKSLYECPDHEAYQAKIKVLFNIEKFEFDDDCKNTLLDMIHNAIVFTSDNNFSYPKAIVFLSIYMEVFKFATSSPFYLPNEVYQKYQDLLMSHSVTRPPVSYQIFEMADTRLINDFFINTFFRYLKIIVSGFTPREVLAFQSKFPVKISGPEIPSLMEMEIFRPELPEQPEELPREETPRSKGQKPGKPERGSTPKSREVLQSPLQERVLELDEKNLDVPMEMLRGSLQTMHEKFVADFETTERQLIGKIKELEIRLHEKPQVVKKPAPKKK